MMPTGLATLRDQLAAAQAKLEKSRDVLQKLDAREDIKAVLAKAEEGEDLNQQELNQQRQYQQASEAVDRAQAHLTELQRINSSNTMVVSAPNGIPTLRGADETWFKDGKLTIGNRSQWKRLEQHHALYHQIKAATASVGCDDPTVESLIQDGIDLCDAQAKTILVGHNEGWKVVQQMQNPEYLKTEEEIKEVASAKRQAQLADKLDKGGKTPLKRSRYAANLRPRAGFFGPPQGPVGAPSFVHAPQYMPGFGPHGAGAGKSMGKAGTCFICNQPGHFARECPNKG
jgi:hypothetical protein